MGSQRIGHDWETFTLITYLSPVSPPQPHPHSFPFRLTRRHLWLGNHSWLPGTWEMKYSHLQQNCSRLFVTIDIQKILRIQIFFNGITKDIKAQILSYSFITKIFHFSQFQDLGHNVPYWNGLRLLGMRRIYFTRKIYKSWRPEGRMLWVLTVFPQKICWNDKPWKGWMGSDLEIGPLQIHPS